MSDGNRFPLSSPPLRSPTRSPAVSAVRSSPLASGSLRSYPFTSSSFTSSPFSFTQPSLSPSPVSFAPGTPERPFSFTQAAASSPGSPDLFEEFSYTEDMDDDFRRIDSDTDAILHDGPDQMNNPIPLQVVPPLPAPPRAKKTWVVFRGTTPGIHDY